MMSGLVAPGALGLGMRVGGRLVYSTLSISATSPRESRHIRSSMRLRISSFPELGAAPAPAGWACGGADVAPTCGPAGVWARRGHTSTIVRGSLVILRNGTTGEGAHGGGC